MGSKVTLDQRAKEVNVVQKVLLVQGDEKVQLVQEDHEAQKVTQVVLRVNKVSLEFQALEVYMFDIVFYVF